MLLGNKIKGLRDKHEVMNVSCRVRTSRAFMQLW